MSQEDDFNLDPLVDRTKRNHNNKKNKEPVDCSAHRAARLRRQSQIADEEGEDDWKAYESR